MAGAANIAGGLGIAAAMTHHDAARLPAGLYRVRAGGVAALLLPSPTPAVLLGFAVAMGASFVATLLSTSQPIAQQHGVQHGTQRLGSLFGVVMRVHQVGRFIGIGIGFGGWAAAGPREAVMETLADNHAMQSLARRAGFKLVEHPEDPDLVFGQRALAAPRINIPVGDLLPSLNGPRCGFLGAAAAS